MENISTRLKKLRKHFDLTQIELAEIIKVGPSTVAMWETKDRKIKDIHISIICKEFSISEEWLRDGTGEMIEQLSADEAIAVWASKITCKDYGNNFVKQFAKMLTELNEDDWVTIEKVVKKLSKYK